MDFIFRAFFFFFAVYIFSLSVHFIHFSGHEAENAARALEGGHEHDLVSDTPLHKYLKHSHERWGQGAHSKLSNISVSSAGDDLHAKLVCEGSEDGLEQNMVYWHKPSAEDDSWVSPWKPKDGSTQYVTFESDNGGWNNVRMALEAIFVFARATGRTVVMPKDEAFYFPDPGVDKKDFFQHTNGYDDFFPLEEMRRRLPGSVISMKEFLEREAYPGHLGARPPVAQAQMEDPASGMHGRKLRDYLRSLANNGTNPHFYLPKFKEGGRLGCLSFPQANPGDPERKTASKQKGKAKGKAKGVSGVDSAVAQRLEEFAAKREVVPLAGRLLTSKVVHFAAWPKQGYRVLMHFYTLYFFADEALARRMKRYVRDHFRYHDHVYCAAHRVASLVRRDAAAHRQRLATGGGSGGTGGDTAAATGVAPSLRSGDAAAASRAHVDSGSFSTYHIRHGDFQFKVVRLGAADILANSKDLLQPNELLYIATDEVDKAGFFAPMRAAGYELRFLDDYFEEANLTGLQSNMLGMVDTIVAAQGRVFVGTWFSTFSGYIIRLRGYAHANTAHDSFYFFLKKKFAMQATEPPSDPFYTREWPTAWEGID